MTYKEFCAWCNERACDGCWSARTAIYCLDITAKINRLPFCKREKEWLKVKDAIETDVVSVINEKIKSLKEGKVYGI